MNHFLIGLWHAMKSGFSATASDDQLSGWTEKKASEHFPKPNLHQKGHSHCLVVCCPSDKDTRVGSQSLLQGIFLIQGSNLCLLHCRQILSHLLCVCVWFSEGGQFLVVLVLPHQGNFNSDLPVFLLLYTTPSPSSPVPWLGWDLVPKLSVKLDISGPL